MPTDSGVYLVPLAVAIVGAYIAFRKAPSEVNKATAEAGQLNTEAQSTIIRDLQSEIARVRHDYEEELSLLRSTHAAEKKMFQKEIAAMRADNQRQAARIQRLEERLSASS